MGKVWGVWGVWVSDEIPLYKNAARPQLQSKVDKRQTATTSGASR